MDKYDFMQQAINEAEKGIGFVNPNPLVGAVIVKDGRIISRDYHHRYGEFHAERNAICSCKEDMNGAEIYVTLEPCCHYGKTPPCTEAIIGSGIRKVYIGSDDPNPFVAGKGAEILRNSGIEVETGILKDECDRLNEIFFHFITHKTPYVIMKYAMTADGKIACANGESKWITGKTARDHVQMSRLRCAGIMAGVGTVIKDDPMLTCRLKNGRNPVRIICDSHLRTPFGSNIVRTASEVPTILACLENAEGQEKYMSSGVQILHIPEKNGHIDLNILMQKLGSQNIDSVLLEGGGELNYSALESGIVNKVEAYIAPKIFGGINAKTPVSGTGVCFPSDAFMLEAPEISRFDDDILIEWRVK
ncbi:MAG: bifunctional diaminohydroxyphosphoribosylaminopyrimidine deaminase/5-amino-6-(5-phosphoribosylamino)uracil reductase RibD [Porcipelethomonas sp.]